VFLPPYGDANAIIAAGYRNQTMNRKRGKEIKEFKFDFFNDTLTLIKYLPYHSEKYTTGKCGTLSRRRRHSAEVQHAPRPAENSLFGSGLAFFKFHNLAFTLQIPKFHNLAFILQIPKFSKFLNSPNS